LRGFCSKNTLPNVILKTKIAMLGHLKPACSLSPDAKSLYRTHYCSVCSALRSQNGLFAAFFINHELTLALHALTPYLNDFKARKTPCPSALFIKKNNAYKHPAAERAAELSYILAWIKSLDEQTDNPALYKKLLEKQLRTRAEKLLQAFPTALAEIIEEFALVTRSAQSNIQTLTEVSGKLSKQCFLYIADATRLQDSAKMSDFFYAVGALIPLADSIADLKKDIQKNESNPILDLANEQKISLEKALLKTKKTLEKIANEILTQVKLLQTENIFTHNFALTAQNIVGNVLHKIGCAPKTCLSCSGGQYAENMNVRAADCYACCDCASCCNSDCSAACFTACCTCGCDLLSNSDCCNTCGEDGCCNNCCNDCCSGSDNSGTASGAKNPSFPDFPKDTVAHDTTDILKQSADSLENTVKDSLKDLKNDFEPIPDSLPEMPDNSPAPQTPTEGKPPVDWT
jgi:hypothetical protein